MSQEQRRKAESLSRQELVELAKYCGMPGASNNFESPYRNRKWICANLPSSLFGSRSTSSTLTTGGVGSRSTWKSQRVNQRRQRGGQAESEGAKATMAAIESGSTGGTSGALAGLAEEIARRARKDPEVLRDSPTKWDPLGVESISDIPSNVDLGLSDLPALPALPETPTIPMEGEYVPGTGKRLKYCATKPPTLPLEIDESDPSYKEIFEALYPPKIGTYAPLPEIPPKAPRPLPAIPEGPLPGLPEVPVPEKPEESPGGLKLSEGAKATLIAMQQTPEPSPYGVLPLGPPPGEPLPTPTSAEYVPIPGPPKRDEYGPLPLLEEPIVPEKPIPETLPLIPEAPPMPAPKKKRAKKAPKKPTCPDGFNMDIDSGLCLEVMKTCPAVEGCKAELESLGLKQKEAERLLESVKEDLIACQSSSAGWKQIEEDLKSINLTKEEADRILVAIGKHLSARIRAGENLDSLLDSMQKTLDQSAATVAALPPIAAQEFALVTGTTVAPPPMPVPKAKTTKAKTVGAPKSKAIAARASSPRPSAAELQAVELRKVTPQEKKSTQKDLESTLQTAVLQNPAFIARRQAIEGTQETGEWA